MNYEPGFPHLFSSVGGNILHNSIYSWQTGARLGYKKTHIIVYNQILLALPSHYISITTKIIFILVKIFDRLSPFAYLIFDKSRNKSVVMKKDKRLLKANSSSLMVCVDREDNLY